MSDPETYPDIPGSFHETPDGFREPHAPTSTEERERLRYSLFPRQLDPDNIDWMDDLYPSPFDDPERDLDKVLGVTPEMRRFHGISQNELEASLVMHRKQITSWYRRFGKKWASKDRLRRIWFGVKKRLTIRRKRG